MESGCYRTTTVNVFMPETEPAMQPDSSYYVSLMHENVSDTDTVKVAIEPKDKTDANSGGCLFCAVYGISGRLLDLQCAEFEDVSSSNFFKFTIPQQEEEIGTIKAYMRSSINDMTPLSQCAEVSCQQRNILKKPLKTTLHLSERL